MRRRVFVIAGEYSANPRHLPPERRTREFLAEPLADLSPAEVERLFFRYPNRSDDGRARPDDWAREFHLSSPIGLTDLLASAAHRALSSLHFLLGEASYQRTRDAVTDLFVTSMPGLDPNERMNIGLVPQSLRALLSLSPRTRSQFVVGTSDSGAWAFTQAVRAARTAERPSTILVVAGQIIPSGYASQYQIRTVLGEDDQARGFDMLAVGDLLMDGLRRSFAPSSEEIEELLAATSARKLHAGGSYPAGILAGKSVRRGPVRRTPFFDGSDIAPPCCGAAATLLTSDEELVERLRAKTPPGLVGPGGGRGPRYRGAPVVEVLGVGEGSSNANFLQRQSPLGFATAIREAFAATADDADVPLTSFASCGFGVVHDAFPSIELLFLRGIGLGWERARARMRDGWSNPFGGLLSFGHALGASGLVQVNKAHHLFSGDRRYIRDAPGRAGFRREGATAFTTSVGGPLSHIVVGLFRGGYAEMPELRQRLVDHVADGDEGPLSRDWNAKRHQLRLVLHAYLARLREEPELGGEPCLVEGTSYVTIRSCLRALADGDVAALTFDGLEKLALPGRVAELRESLRQLVLLVRMEADRLASMFDVFRILADEVRRQVGEWHAGGAFAPQAAALGVERLADQMKELLRVPLAILTRLEPGGTVRRTVRFLPLPGAAGPLGYEDLRDADLLVEQPDGRFRPLPRIGSRELLPWWSGQAVREDRPPPPSRAHGAPALVDELIARGGPLRAQTRAEAELLRLFFSPDTPSAALEQAVRAAGDAAVKAEQAQAVFYLGEIASVDPLLDARAAQAFFAHAAEQARAWLEAYETSTAQIGRLLSVACIDARADGARAEDKLLAAARFARELACLSLESGVVVRAALGAGDARSLENVGGSAGIASAAADRAHELLARTRQRAGLPASRPWIAVEGTLSGLLLERLRQRLQGFEELPAEGDGDALVFAGPSC